MCEQSVHECCDFVSMFGSTAVYNCMCRCVNTRRVHQCVRVEDNGGTSMLSGWNWKEAEEPAAVTDHLLCSFSTPWVFSKPFPLQHTRGASLSYNAVVAHLCCTTLITYKEKAACVSERDNESGLMICNVWVPFTAERKEEEESNSKL